MKTLLNTTAAASLAAALALAVAAPASAQVSGIGVADPAIVIAGSKALQGAYGQIGTTYQAQRTQLQQLDEQRVALLKKYDTNKDGQLDATEQKAAQADKQLQTLEQQINTAQGPINLAAAYAIQQIAQQLSPAVQQVVSQGNVQLILPSEGVLYRSEAADLNEKIVNALDAKVAQVSITPPKGWQPDQNTVQLFQDVQQIRLAAAVRQQQAAAAQQPATQPQVPASRATTPPPKGR